MSDTNFQQEGYADAEPGGIVDPEAGSYAVDINAEAHEAYAKAHLTGTGREEGEAPPPPEA